MLSSSTHLKPQGRPASPQSTASTLSNITVVDAAVQPTDSSITASSTPPTSQSDSQSVHEDAPNHTDPSAPRRHSSRRRSTVATYNDKENAGTRIHTPAKYRKDTPLQPQPPHHTTTPDEAEQVKQVEQAEQAKQAEQVEQVEPVEQVEHAEQRQQTEEPEPPTPADEPMHRRQSGRARNSIVTYNDKENAGTRIHTPTKYIDGTYIRKTLHDPIPGIPQPQSQSPPSANNLSKHSLKRRASGLRTELRADSSDEESETDAQSAPRRKPLRLGDRSSKHTQTLASQLGKRGREAFEAAKSKAGASTKKGADKTDGTANKRQKKTIIRRAISSPIPSPPPQPPARPVLNYGPPGKPWLYHGKFHNTGQDDLVGKLSIIVGHKPKAGEESVRQNSVLPLPMFMMAEKLDLYPKKKVPESKRPFEPFQMPYDVFCPLPKEAKVKDWRELKKSEYRPTKITCCARLTSDQMSTRAKMPKRSSRGPRNRARSKGTWKPRPATASAAVKGIPASTPPSSSSATIGAATLVWTAVTVNSPICRGGTRTTDAKESTSRVSTSALKSSQPKTVVTVSAP